MWRLLERGQDVTPADLAAEFGEWDRCREAEELAEAESAQTCENAGHQMRHAGYECIRCGASFWMTGSD